jgi:hypothetical protein
LTATGDRPHSTQPTSADFFAAHSVGIRRTCSSSKRRAQGACER